MADECRRQKWADRPIYIHAPRWCMPWILALNFLSPNWPVPVVTACLYVTLSIQLPASHYHFLSFSHVHTHVMWSYSHGPCWSHYLPPNYLTPWPSLWAAFAVCVCVHMCAQHPQPMCVCAQHATPVCVCYLMRSSIYGQAEIQNCVPCNAYGITIK